MPIDVVKTRMQSEPERYPSMLPTFRKLLKEEGSEAFLLGAGDARRNLEVMRPFLRV